VHLVEYLVALYHFQFQKVLIRNSSMSLFFLRSVKSSSYRQSSVMWKVCHCSLFYLKL